MKLSQIDIIVKVVMALHAAQKAIECVSGQIVCCVNYLSIQILLNILKHFITVDTTKDK